MKVPYALGLIVVVAGLVWMAMPVGRVGIDAENGSDQAVVAQLQGRHGSASEPVTLLPGQRGRLTAVVDYRAVWVSFSDASTNRDLGKVPVTSQDRRGDRFVVTYPSVRLKAP